MCKLCPFHLFPAPHRVVSRVPEAHLPFTHTPPWVPGAPWWTTPAQTRRTHRRRCRRRDHQ